MLRLSHNEDAQILLPGQGGGLFAVLFSNSTRPGAEALEARFSELQWPADLRQVIVDTRTASASAEWFGLGEGPAMALICEGSLLAVEYECSDGVCDRILKIGYQQLAALAGV